MSQTGNYKMDANHVFAFACVKLDLLIEKDYESFFKGWGRAVGQYKGYGIVLTRKDTLHFLNLLIYKYHNGKKVSSTAAFSIDIIQEQGIDACIGMLAQEIEKAIAQ